MSRALRLFLSAAAGVAAFIVSAVTVAIADLYLAGHDLLSLDLPWIDWDGAGVHLSRADGVCLVAAVVVAVLAWRFTARVPHASLPPSGK